ncbi:hypothetical protein G6L32_14390 [Agrobacterium tumefaciens]|uniref:hypothetical protein n=1 Tax=Agrobacterium tumefaciens TaxID=358 RepID=UPI001574B51E|nr:hypothetical protein [Agrobacterium tumefaciens]
MADVPAFQDHHIIERQAYRDSPLLNKLSSQGLFNLDDSANRLNLPADYDTAAKMQVSPHMGGPLANYSDALEEILSDLTRSPDGRLALQGDRAAAERVATQVNSLRDTMRAGLINGELLTNKPNNMTVAEARNKINGFFRNWESYAEAHASQIERYAKGQVNAWDAVTVSETRMQAAIDAIEQSGKKAAKGLADVKKFELGLAIAEARQAGRLVVSPAFAQKLDTIWDTKQLNDVLSGKVSASSKSFSTFSKGLNVLGRAGTAYDVGTSTLEAANAVRAGDKVGAANIMARLMGRIYAGAKGAAAGAALGGAVGAPSGPAAFVSSLLGGLVGGSAGAAIGDEAVDALWKAAGQAISILQAGAPEAGVDTPLLQPSGKYYRGLIASGMPKDVADKLMQELNAEYKKRRLEQPDASVESIVESVIKDVRANQAIEPQDEAGASVTVIKNKKYATTIINSATGKTEIKNKNKTGKPISSISYDRHGKKKSTVRFNADGSSIQNKYDSDTGQVTSSTTVGVDKSRSTKTFNPQGKVVREQRYDASGNVTFDSKIERQKKQAAAAADAEKRAAANAETKHEAGEEKATKQAAERRAAEAEKQRDAEREKLQRELEDAAFEQMRRQGAFKDMPPSSTIGSDPKAGDAAKEQAAAKEEAEKAEAQKKATSKANAEKKAAAKADAEKKAAAKADAEKKAAAKADAEKKAAAKADAEKKAAAKADAERKERERIAAESARAVEEQRRRVEEARKQREQASREAQERQRKMQEQWKREDEERRRHAAAEQARRDAEADRLRRQMDATRIPGSGGGRRPAPGMPTPTPRPSLPSTRPWIGVPVVFDLNGDGVLDIRPLHGDAGTATSTSEHASGGNVQPVKAPPVFDWNGDGVADQTAWVGPEDGLLVIDLAVDGTAGADGKIDRPREVAFALWKTEDERQAELKAQGIDDTGRPVTDLEGLRFAFDSNGDTILDANDARWSEFRVWQDHNQNGVADDGELRTLDEVGIKFISLLPSPEGARAFADGSAITGTSTAQKVDGTSILVGDVTLAFRPSVSG